MPFKDITDSEFWDLEEAKQKKIALNYFNQELADSDFKELPSQEQFKIKRNFLLEELTEPVKIDSPAVSTKVETEKPKEPERFDFYGEREEKPEPYTEEALEKVQSDTYLESPKRYAKDQETQMPSNVQFKERSMSLATPKASDLGRPLKEEEEKWLDLKYHKELAKEYPNDYYAGTTAAMDAFMQGLLPIRKLLSGREQEGLEEAYPLQTGAGALAGLIGTGYLTGGVAPAVKGAKILQTLPTVARVVAGRMAQSSATLGLKKLVDEMAEYMVGDDKKVTEVIKETAKSAAWGAGLGGVGSIPQPLLRIPAQAAYGFTTAKLEGASNEQAGIQAAVLGLFGLFNTKNISVQYKNAAYKGSMRALAERLIGKGYNKKHAYNLADRFFRYALHKAGAMRAGKVQWNKVKVKDFDELGKALRKGAKIVFGKGGTPPDVSKAKLIGGKTTTTKPPTTGKLPANYQVTNKGTAYKSKSYAQSIAAKLTKKGKVNYDVVPYGGGYAVRKIDPDIKEPEKYDFYGEPEPEEFPENYKLTNKGTPYQHHGTALNRADKMSKEGDKNYEPVKWRDGWAIKELGEQEVPEGEVPETPELKHVRMKGQDRTYIKIPKDYDIEESLPHLNYFLKEVSEKQTNDTDFKGLWYNNKPLYSKDGVAMDMIIEEADAVANLTRDTREFKGNLFKELDMVNEGVRLDEKQLEFEQRDRYNRKVDRAKEIMDEFDNVEFKGIKQGAVWFNIEEGEAKGTTSAIPLDDMSPEAVENKLAEKQKQFAEAKPVKDEVEKKKPEMFKGYYEIHQAYKRGELKVDDVVKTEDGSHVKLKKADGIDALGQPKNYVLEKVEKPKAEEQIELGEKGALLEEAREYETPEEFVEKHIFYRGEGFGEEGNYYTKSKKFAKEFAGEKPLTEAVIPESQIYRPPKLAFAKNESEVTKSINEAKDKGFKAVYISEGKPFGKKMESVFVFDKSVLKTKENIEDIWDEAYGLQDVPFRKLGEATDKDIKGLESSLKELQNILVGNKNLIIVDEIPGNEKRVGMYLKGISYIKNTMNDPFITLPHEGIHLTIDMLLTGKEKSGLFKALDELGQTEEDLAKKFDDYTNKYGYEINEEGIKQTFWGKIRVFIKRLLRKLKRFFKKDTALDKVEGFYDKYLRGEFAKRPAGKTVPAVATTPATAQAKAYADAIYSNTARVLGNPKVIQQFGKKGMKTNRVIKQLKRYGTGKINNEIDFMGLEEWLEGKDRVTIDELKNFVNQNKVVLEDVVKTVEEKAIITKDNIESVKLVESKQFGDSWIVKLDNGAEVSVRKPFDADTKEEAIEVAIEEYSSDIANYFPYADIEVEHFQYQLPSGSHYKEWLVRAPELGKPISFEEWMADKYPSVWEKWWETYPDEGKSAYRVAYEKEKGYTSGHWGETNVVAHTRSNHRITPDGNTVFFLEELQSDWATDIKEGKTKEEMPFIGDEYMKLALKKMIRYAAENDFDYLSWTTGQQQIDRWNTALRKNVDKIEWEKVEDGVAITTFRDGKINFDHVIPLEGEVQIQNQRATLNNIVGKNIANQIRHSRNASGDFVGKDLSIGGEGMIEFYNRKIPNYLKKYIKKWGGKLTKIEVPTRDVDNFYEKSTTTQQAITITPEMKEAVLFKGQPMFREIGKGKELTAKQKELRKKLLAKGHILAKELGYTEKKDYKKFLQENFNIDSLGNLNIDGLSRIVNEIEQMKESADNKKLQEAEKNLEKVTDPKKIYNAYDKTVISPDPKTDTKYIDRLRKRVDRLTKDTRINTYKSLDEALNKTGAETKRAFWNLQMSQREMQVKNNEFMIDFHRQAKKIYREEKNVFEKVSATRADYENKKFTQKLIDYFETGETDDNAVRRIGDLYQEYNKKLQPHVRAARLVKYITTGNEKYIGFLDAENSDEVVEATKKVAEILDKVDPKRFSIDKAIDQIIEEMKDYTFGVRETYYPTEHEQTAEEFTESLVSGTAPPTGKTGQLKTGKGEPNLKQFWYKFNNTIYDNEGLLKMLPRINALRNTLSREQNRSMDPMYKTVVRKGTGLNSPAKTFRFLFSLGFQGYLLSQKGLGADIRNLTQNVAMAYYFPVRSVIRESGKGAGRKLLKLLKNKKQLDGNELENKFLDKQEREFLRHLSAKGVFAHAMFMSGVWAREIPILRKVETFANVLSKHYTATDVLNRKMAVTLLKPLQNLVQEAEVKDYKKLSRKLKINQFHPSTQLALADIFKYDKPTFFTEYIRQKVLKIHHQYERSGRSLFMQAKQSRVFSPLLVFPVSTISKYLESIGNMVGKHRTTTDRLQAAETLFFKSATDVLKMGLYFAIWAGTTLGVYSLFFGDDDEEQRKKVLESKRTADKIIKFSTYICPPAIANYLITKIKGYPYENYGLKEMSIGNLPLARIAGGISAIFYDLESGRLSPDEFIMKHLVSNPNSPVAVAQMPLVKTLVDGLSAYYNINPNSAPGILVNTLIKEGKLPKKEYLTEIREKLNEEMDKRGYQAYYKKKIEEMMPLEQVQKALFGRETSLRRARQKAIDTQFKRRVLWDLMAWEKPGSKNYKKLQEELDRLQKELDKLNLEVPVRAKVLNDASQYEINMNSKTIDKKLEELLGREEQ